MSKEKGIFWEFIGMIEADGLIQTVEQSEQTVTGSDGLAVACRFKWPRHRSLPDDEAKECHREAVAKLAGKRYAPPMSLNEDQVEYIERCLSDLRVHFSMHAADIGWACINGPQKREKTGRKPRLPDYNEKIEAELRKLVDKGISSHSQACTILAARKDSQGNRVFPFSAEYMRKSIPNQMQ